jgi:hypothetical protein
MDIHCDYDPEAITPLCGIMNTFGSDKGDGGKEGAHNYTTFYYALFKRVRFEPLYVFELGLGTNNVDVPSNMGPHGLPGASLRGWRQYFPNAHIYGADIDERILFQEDRIQTYACDQTDPQSIQRLWSHFPTTSFDILLEDGLHTFEANVCFFEHSIHKLAKGGVYVIEDINEESIPKFEAILPEWKQKWSHLDFRLVNIPYQRSTKGNIVLLAQHKG